MQNIKKQHIIILLLLFAFVTKLAVNDFFLYEGEDSVELVDVDDSSEENEEEKQEKEFFYVSFLYVDHIDETFQGVFLQNLGSEKSGYTDIYLTPPDFS